MGPQRDLLGELAKAVRAEGLHFGASSHRVEHDFFLGGGRAIRLRRERSRSTRRSTVRRTTGSNNGNERRSANDFTFVSQAWTGRLAGPLGRNRREIPSRDHVFRLVDRPAFLPQPTLPASPPFTTTASRSTATSRRASTTRTTRCRSTPPCSIWSAASLASIRPLPWQTDTSISNNSWGYIEHDTFKSPEFVIHQLVDIVSKNGNLLMNIGPRPDGTIPDEVQQMLARRRRLAEDQRRSHLRHTALENSMVKAPRRSHAGSFHDTDTAVYTAQDFRFTTKGNTLYAIELGKPSGKETVIHSFSSDAERTPKVDSVSLLGVDGTLTFHQQPDGLHIELPPEIRGKYAYAFRILPVSVAQ